MDTVRERERDKEADKEKEKKEQEGIHGKKRQIRRDQEFEKRRRCDGARALIEVHVLTLLGISSVCRLLVQRMRSVGGAAALSCRSSLAVAVPASLRFGARYAYACIRRVPLCVTYLTSA